MALNVFVEKKFRVLLKIIKAYKNNVWNCWLYSSLTADLPYRVECAGSRHFDVDKTRVDSDRARAILAQNAF
jgi:hypothetical protein